MTKKRRTSPKVPQAPTVEIDGVLPDDPVDDEAIYRRAVEDWQQVAKLEKRRAGQVLKFERGPVALAFVADHHFGDPGVDYERCFKEAELIASTPGMFAVTVGDLVNNFIVPKLANVRNAARLSIFDEWALARRYLKVIGPKLVASVAGNHDNWVDKLAGIDYWREVLKSINANCIYDRDDARLVVRVGYVEWAGRIRHQWAGNSIYNPTHAIERAAKWDQDFIWGVGAHTHASGVVRTFNKGGTNAIAALCGSYKRVDGFARERGFAKPNTSTAVVILFDETTRTLTGFDSLEMVAWLLRLIYRKQ